MQKQRATEILMEALCMSVPYDPAYVLEVHKDVLKMRLRCTYVQFDLTGVERHSFCRPLQSREYYSYLMETKLFA